MAEDMGRELGWDDEITVDDEFVLLPEGDYRFRVEDVERARHPGSENLPACNKAIVSLRVFSDLGDVTLKNNLFLHSKTERMLSQFFTCIGMKKKGEPLKMDFKGAIGKEGKVKVGTREYNGNKYNEVKRFLRPEEQFKALDKEEDDLDW